LDIIHKVKDKYCQNKRGAIDGDLDQVIVIARHKVRFEHFGERRELGAEARECIVVVTVERHFEQHDVGEAELLLIQQRDIAANVAFVFQLTCAIPACRGRHADQFRQFRIA